MTVKHSNKTFSANFFTKNFKWTSPEMNRGLSDEKPDTNHQKKTTKTYSLHIYIYIYQSAEPTTLLLQYPELSTQAYLLAVSLRNERFYIHPFSIDLSYHYCSVEDEYRMHVWKNRVLRSLMWTKWEEVTGDCRKLHDVCQSKNLLASSNQKRSDKQVTQHVCGRRQNACRVLLGISEVKRPLGRRRCIEVYNIKMELKAVVWIGMTWSHLALNVDKRQAALNTGIKLLLSQYEGNFFTT